MPYKNNLLNNRFGRLLVIRETLERQNGRNIVWECICDCGKTTEVAGTNLVRGKTKSCGCLQKEWAQKHYKEIGKNNLKHGESGKRSSLYSVWCTMKNRCYSENWHKYKRYGLRGIEVCDKWRDNYSTFKQWALENGYKEGLTIDRINNNGNYEPNNCQWITQGENTLKYWHTDSLRG
jgi:hypothetical protein